MIVRTGRGPCTPTIAPTVDPGGGELLSYGDATTVLPEKLLVDYVRVYQ
ncbi:hypothetical protein ACGFIV_07660 [Sphaerisporangium sp. NPDC049003]